MIEFKRYAKIPLDELVTFPGNANIGDVPKILESLCANGQYRDLVVREQDGTFTVLCGNHTKAAMVEHGAGKCKRDTCLLCGGSSVGFDGAPRCQVFTCSDDEATRINLADNRISEFSRRDDDALADLLMSLEDLTGSGYTPDDLKLYLPQEVPTLDDLAEEYGDVEDEETPVLPVLSFRVTPQLRDRFLELTEDAPEPTDPVSRFEHLLGLAENE